MIEVKMKGIMKVFEVGDHPLWMVTLHYGWYRPFLGGEHSLGDVAPPWVWADLLKKHWSPTTEGRHHPQSVVIELKPSMKMSQHILANKFYIKRVLMCQYLNW